MSDSTKVTLVVAGAIMVLAGRLWLKRLRAAQLADDLLAQVLREKDDFRR